MRLVDFGVTLSTLVLLATTSAFGAVSPGSNSSILPSQFPVGPSPRVPRIPRVLLPQTPLPPVVVDKQ